MKRLLRTSLGLALGLVSLPASAQELNFRAVVPPKTAAVSAEVPLTLSQPTPIDVNFQPAVARGKGEDRIVQVSDSFTVPTRFAQNPQRFNPLPPGAPGEFPPPPQIVNPNPNPGVIVNGPGQVVNGPIVDGPINGQVVNGPMMGGPAPYSVLSGAVVDGGCCGNACGAGCCTDSCWGGQHPFDRIYDFFTCNDGCGSCCCMPRTPLWVRGEFLLYSVTRQQLPALVTQAPLANQTALDSGASTLLYGNQGTPSTFMNGGRISAGFWLPNHCDWGVDGSFFFLGQRTDSFNASSNGTPALGRPFLDQTPLIVRDVLGGGATALIANPNNNLQNAEIVAGNGTPGSINVTSTTQFNGWDVNLRRKLCCGPNYWLDGLVGFRSVNLQDSVDITEDIGPRVNGGSSASRTVVHDGFFTRNQFYGAQIGLEGEWRFRPRWSLGSSFKIAAGNMHQNINITGDTTLYNAVFPSGNTFARQTQSGGLLAQRSNVGSYSTDRFAVLPELGVKLNFDITPHWRIFAGYNVMYLSNVVRAGEQIDTRVNYSQAAFSGYTPANAVAGQRVVLNGTQGVLLPNSPAVPGVLFRTNEFWAQGVNFGVEYRY